LGKKSWLYAGRADKKSLMKEKQISPLTAGNTSSIKIGDKKINSSSFHVWAGPCAVETKEQFSKTAEFVKKQGASAVRAGIFKLRSSPKSFQGLGVAGLPLLEKVKNQLNILTVTEVTDPRQIESLEPLVDICQVGTRNMFNYELLKELGGVSKPVLLKRAFSARIEEWLMAADYLVQNGNDQVILCERGIRSFETKTRNTLDLNAVAFLKKESSFPVFVDPSHGTGLSALVPAMSLAAVSAGADGLLIEVHPNPAKALSDGQQALSFPEFEKLISKLKSLLALYNKKL